MQSEGADLLSRYNPMMVQTCFDVAMCDERKEWRLFISARIGDMLAILTGQGLFKVRAHLAGVPT